MARDFAGEAQAGFLYLVSLAVAGYQFDNFPVLGTQRNEVLIGRDILNQLDVNPNGPVRLMTIYQSSARSVPGRLL